MVTTILSLCGGILLAVFLLGLILREIRTLFKRRLYSPWRGIIPREGIAGAWIFLLFRYVRVRPGVFMVAFLASYFTLMALFANCVFREARNCGRST